MLDTPSTLYRQTKKIGYGRIAPQENHKKWLKYLSALRYGLIIPQCTGMEKQGRHIHRWGEQVEGQVAPPIYYS